MVLMMQIFVIYLNVFTLHSKNYNEKYIFSIVIMEEENIFDNIYEAY